MNKVKQKIEAKRLGEMIRRISLQEYEGYLPPGNISPDDMEALQAVLECIAAPDLGHKWTVSTLGHGEKQCLHCHATNREIAVIGDLNFCPDNPHIEGTTQ